MVRLKLSEKMMMEVNAWYQMGKTKNGDRQQLNDCYVTKLTAR